VCRRQLQHRPSGAGEDRNAHLRPFRSVPSSQHRPSGAGEDRNFKNNATSNLAIQQHRPSGAGEDRNAHLTFLVSFPATSQHRPSGAGEDRNLFSDSVYEIRREAAPALRGR